MATGQGQHTHVKPLTWLEVNGRLLFQKALPQLPVPGFSKALWGHLHWAVPEGLADWLQHGHPFVLLNEHTLSLHTPQQCKPIAAVWMALSENVHQWGRPGDMNLTLLSQPFVLEQLNFQLLCEVEVTPHSFFLSHTGSAHGRCAVLSLVRAPPARFLVAPLLFCAVPTDPGGVIVT